MNNEETVLYKKIINYNGSTKLFIFVSIFISPFLLQFFISGDLGFPTGLAIIGAEVIFIPLFVLRVIRDYILRFNLYPKEGMSIQEYDKCIVIIDRLTPKAFSGRMANPKFHERSEQYANALDYFKKRIDNLKSAQM